MICSWGNKFDISYFFGKIPVMMFDKLFNMKRGFSTISWYVFSNKNKIYSKPVCSNSAKLSVN